MTHKFPPAALTESDRQRIEQLRTDGVPATWIAEDVGVRRETVIAVQHANPDDTSEWLSVWPTIRKRPELYALHKLFAPKVSR